MPDAIDTIIARMTIEEKIGQMVLAALPGPGLDAAAIAHLRAHHFGGVVLFSRNIETVEQTRALTAALYDRLTVGGLPPLIGVDQEGGRVQRLMPEATSFPSAMALGATHDPALVERIGRAVGYELRALGINTNFAPVADVNNNPLNPVIGTRAFGESPERVSAMVVAFANGLRAAGVAATVKHFPGHGDTQVDSHLDLPMISHDLARLRATELPPFAAAIRAGVPLVMTAHIRFPALEPDGLPATLSRRILHDLLREEMGFEGVVISDAMMMRAIEDHYGIVVGSVQAIIAGNDIIEPFQQETEIVAALLDAVHDGRLPLARVDASVRRILRLKQWLAGFRPVAPYAVGSSTSFVLDAAEASVTLVDAQPGALPLAPGASLAVAEFSLQSGHAAEEKQRLPSPLFDEFHGPFEAVRGISLDAIAPADDAVAAAYALAMTADALVIGTRDANLFPAQRAAIDSLRTANRPTVLISMRAPYDLAEFPWAAARIATYGDLSASLLIAAMICGGGLLPRGRLPVGIAPDYPCGHGLTALP